MSDGVHRVRTKEEVLAVFTDRFLRWQMTPHAWIGAWVTPAAVAVLRHRDSGHQLLAVGDPGDVVRLLQLAAEEPAPSQSAEQAVRLTVETRALDRLPAQLRPDPEQADGWEWMWTDRTPPPVPGEAAVGWVDADERLRSLLQAANPRHHGRPGDPDIRGWAGVRDDSGRLLAAGALAVLDTGIPSLRSISTDPAARGRGMGAAVSAFLTRHALSLAPVATLGLYSDNDIARRLYTRLGYQPSHAFCSGPLTLSTSASVRSA